MISIVRSAGLALVALTMTVDLCQLATAAYYGRNEGAPSYQQQAPLGAPASYYAPRPPYPNAANYVKNGGSNALYGQPAPVRSQAYVTPYATPCPSQQGAAMMPAAWNAAPYYGPRPYKRARPYKKVRRPYVDDRAPYQWSSSQNDNDKSNDNNYNTNNNDDNSMPSKDTKDHAPKAVDDDKYGANDNKDNNDSNSDYGDSDKGSDKNSERPQQQKDNDEPVTLARDPTSNENESPEPTQDDTAVERRKKDSGKKVGPKSKQSTATNGRKRMKPNKSTIKANAHKSAIQSSDESEPVYGENSSDETPSSPDKQMDTPESMNDQSKLAEDEQVINDEPTMKPASKPTKGDKSNNKNKNKKKRVTFRVRPTDPNQEISPEFVQSLVDKMEANKGGQADAAATASAGTAPVPEGEPTMATNKGQQQAPDVEKKASKALAGQLDEDPASKAAGSVSNQSAKRSDENAAETSELGQESESKSTNSKRKDGAVSQSIGDSASTNSKSKLEPGGNDSVTSAPGGGGNKNKDDKGSDARELGAPKKSNLGQEQQPTKPKSQSVDTNAPIEPPLSPTKLAT